MLSNFDQFNEAKKVKKSPKKVAKKAAKKTAKEYMFRKAEKVPKAIKVYSEMIFKAVEESFDKWFFRKSLANYKKEITFNWDTIRQEIPTKQFQYFPVEDIEVDLYLKTSKSSKSKNFEESGVYKTISPELIDFDLVSFKQTSGSDIVEESYFLRFNFEIIIPHGLVSIEVENFKERIRAAIYHEMAHAYDNVIHGGISTARAHVVDAANLKLLSAASPTINRFLYLAYIASPEEIYANTIGSYGFNSFERYKKHWVYDEVKRLKEFNADEFIKSLRDELPEDAVWESHDLKENEVIYYHLPEDFPKLFADYHDDMFSLITRFSTVRTDYHHDTYSNMRDMSLEEFSKYWEHEFNTAGEHYEDNIIKVINSKKKK